MKHYAFIDVANTKETAKTVFNFRIDWEKMFTFLKSDKWQCEEIFYYEGRTNDKKFDNRERKLKTIGYSVKNKQTFFQKNKEKKVKFICEKCLTENSFEEAKFYCSECSQEKIIPINNKGTHPKANFDVELAVDALSYAKPGTAIILFTGDGDFCYLAEKLIERGALVVFVSTYRDTLTDKKKRFSTRLKNLLRQEEERARKTGEKTRIRFLEIDNFRNLISKDEDEKEENAAKRDVSE